MFNVDINLESLRNLADEDTIQRIGNQAASNLALLTQAKIAELSAERLHTRRQKFLEGVSMRQEEEGVWIIHLNEDQEWVELGLEAHSMLPDLINSPKARTAKDGSRYMIVPFVNKVGQVGPTQTTPYQQDLVKAIKTQLKELKIPWGKIEKDEQGKPKLGKLHSLKLKTPIKTHEGPGMGWGALNEPRQGPTGWHFLEGAQIFQTQNEKGKVERGVITFRIASEKMLGTQRWFHPGLEPANIFKDAYEWAENEVKDHILPEIIKQIQEMNK